MLIENFNKISGTELRTKNPAYAIFESIIELIEKNEELKEEKDIKEESFYGLSSLNNYYKKDRKKINRATMFKKTLNNLDLWNFVEKYKVYGTKQLNSKFYVQYLNNVISSLQKEQNNCVFSKIIELYEFLIEKEKDLDVLKMSYLILCIEKDESIIDLYNRFSSPDSILEHLAKEASKDIDYKSIVELDITNFGYRKKPITYWNIIEETFYLYKKYFQTNAKNLIDLKKSLILIYEKSKADKKINSTKTKYRRILFKDEKRLEPFSSLQEFTTNIWKIRFKDLFKEYSDINNRWFLQFNLINSKSQIDNKISWKELEESLKNFIYEDSSYKYKEIQKLPQTYPIGKEDVLNFFVNLDKSNYEERIFDLKTKYKKYESFYNLDSNATIMEYMVNLYYAYKFSFSIEDFLKFSRTIVDAFNLLPIIHAPGKGADMEIYTNNKLIIIETTIHKDIKNILKNEFFQSMFHSLDKLKDFQEEEVTVNINLIAFWETNDKEELRSIQTSFLDLFRYFDTDYLNKKKISFNLINFNELI